MADELVMPRLSDTMERGTIARWVKQEGEAFQNGDVLAEIVQNRLGNSQLAQVFPGWTPTFRGVTR